MPTKVIRFKEGRYEGEVNSAGDPEGSGTLEYPGNDEFLRQIYEGDFVNKKAHGKGMMRWNQGDKYEGEWQEGLRHGQGLYFSKVSPSHLQSGSFVTVTYSSAYSNTNKSGPIFSERFLNLYKNTHCIPVVVAST